MQADEEVGHKRGGRDAHGDAADLADDARSKGDERGFQYGDEHCMDFGAGEPVIFRPSVRKEGVGRKGVGAELSGVIGFAALGALR